MQEQFIHFAALAEMEIAFGMADCDLAVARMLVITGIVREVMAGPGVQPPCRFPGLSVNLELRQGFAAPLTKTIEPGYRLLAGSPGAAANSSRVKWIATRRVLSALPVPTASFRLLSPPSLIAFPLCPNQHIGSASLIAISTGEYAPSARSSRSRDVGASGGCDMNRGVVPRCFCAAWIRNG
jgi:hypothetical protein